MYYSDRMSSVVISVRIPKELKERIEKLDVNLSEVIRGLLERYVERAEQKRLKERLRRLKQRLKGRVDPTVIANLVREDRAER